jgi:hypothetical protein
MEMKKKKNWIDFNVDTLIAHGEMELKFGKNTPKKKKK